MQLTDNNLLAVTLEHLAAEVAVKPEVKMGVDFFLHCGFVLLDGVRDSVHVGRRRGGGFRGAGAEGEGGPVHVGRRHVGRRHVEVCWGCS